MVYIPPVHLPPPRQDYSRQLHAFAAGPGETIGQIQRENTQRDQWEQSYAAQLARDEFNQMDANRRFDLAASQIGQQGLDPPKVQEFYDEETGNPYKAGWNPQTGSWERIGGVKTPSSGVTVNVGDDADAAFAKEFGKANAGQFFDRRQLATDAALSIEANTEARKLLNEGVITGLGANWIVGFGKALQQAGFTASDDAIANTEAFVATRAQEVGRIIKLFGAGTGLSDADRAFAQQAAAGQINMNEASIRRILHINDKAARNVIKRFNLDAEAIDPSMSPYPLTVQEPTAPPPPAPPAPPDEGWTDLGEGVRIRPVQ